MGWRIEILISKLINNILCNSYIRWILAILAIFELTSRSRKASENSRRSSIAQIKPSMDCGFSKIWKYAFCRNWFKVDFFWQSWQKAHFQILLKTRGDTLQVGGLEANSIIARQVMPLASLEYQWLGKTRFFFGIIIVSMNSLVSLF